MSTSDRGRLLRRYMEEHKADIVRDLSLLAAIPSVEGSSTPDAPFGVFCKEALDTALALFSPLGAKITDAATYGLADVGTGEAHIGVFTHLDVVPAGDGWRVCEPFTPTLCDGVLYGRGVVDNKSGAIAALYALRALNELGMSPKNRVRVFLGTNEESGMRDIEDFTKNEARKPDVSLVPDSSFPFCCGEKGICRFFVHTPPFHDVLKIEGGSAFNVVLDRAQITLRGTDALFDELKAAIGDDGDFSLSYLDGNVLLTAVGIPAHASEPKHSKNAFSLAARLLSGCRALSANDREIFRELASLLRDPYGTSWEIAYTDEDFGPLTATNGIVRGDLRGLTFSMDVRYGTELCEEELEARILRVVSRVGMGWKAEFVENQKGFKIAADSVYAKALCDVYKRASGGEAKPFYMGGGTYARYLPNAFSVGTVASYGEGMTSGRYHATDEFLSIPAFLEGIAVIAEMIVCLDEQLTKEQEKSCP